MQNVVYLKVALYQTKQIQQGKISAEKFLFLFP